MAYISAIEVREIRNELKNAFPNTKFSVRKNASSSTVKVAILKSDFNFAEEVGGYHQVNEYYIKENFFNKKTVSLFEKMIDIIHSAPAKVLGGRAWFDNSDVMTDYFHTAYYMSLEVGEWNKPFKLVK
jgi:hypothetical protein